MLEELRIQNFAIIDTLQLEFSAGFNVITGETGAGKSIIIDAVELLMGGKADAGTVRAGADRAIVEGVFALNEHARMLILPLLLQENLIEEAEAEQLRFVTLTRELRSSGRSSGRINGVTVNTDVLREVGEVLVDIHGQSAHFSLFRPRAHLDLLDRYADLLEVRAALATVVETLNGIRAQIRSLMQDKAELQRRADLLRYEVEEIQRAKLDPDEEAELRAERNRLANSEQLATLCSEASLLLSGDDSPEALPAVDQLMQVANILSRLARIDADLSEDSDLAESISQQAQELALTIAAYAEDIEFDPDRLDELEERLELIKTLKRRYHCDSIADILAYGERAAAELDSIDNSEVRLEALAMQEDKLLRHIGELSLRISKARDAAGRSLAKRIVRELQDLRMERTQFEVVMQHIPDAKGCYVGDERLSFDATGIDKVEFMMSANPGEPLRPLAKVASGGEAARIMLALKRVLSQADETPILIFDEIDQGIGGRIGSVVGEKLWSLTDGHQVMVVTHMAQLASFGDRHYHVRKQINGQRTATEVQVLDSDEQRVDELAAMLGTAGDAGYQSAREILGAARARKLNLHPSAASLD